MYYIVFKIISFSFKQFSERLYRKFVICQPYMLTFFFSGINGEHSEKMAKNKKYWYVFLNEEMDEKVEVEESDLRSMNEGEGKLKWPKPSCFPMSSGKKMLFIIIWKSATARVKKKKKIEVFYKSHCHSPKKWLALFIFPLFISYCMFMNKRHFTWGNIIRTRIYSHPLIYELLLCCEIVYDVVG